jgi:hypothetical protein
MEFWDFDERNNYTTKIYKGESFKVLSLYNNPNLAAKRLYESKLLINMIADKIRENIPTLNGRLKNMCIVFLSIHPDYYFLQEMQIGTPFEGLNKPREVKINNYLPSLGPDKKLKASHRGVFLQLRRRDTGFIKSFQDLVPLIIHEIAHTGCNHVRWRDDDHGEDFLLFETYLKTIVKQL